MTDSGDGGGPSASGAGDADADELSGPLEPNHDSDSCIHCNGYYGPSFGDPVCGTCHDFLYVDDFGVTQLQSYWGYGSEMTSTVEKDDGDSGNDEPSEEAGVGPVNGMLAGHPQQPAALFPVPHNDGDVSSEEDEGPVVAPPAPVVPPIVPAAAKALEPGSSSMDAFYLRSHPCLPLRTSPQRERMTSRLAQLTSPLPAHQRSPPDDLTPKLPPEIWGVIFKKLDTISLLMASKTSAEWNTIIRAIYPQDTWEGFVRSRWPLFHPIYEVSDWYSLFSGFVDRLSCKRCWMSMNLPTNLATAAGRSLRSVRLNKELKWLRDDHPEGVEAVPIDNLNYNWLARVNGPPQSPYQGGIFYLNLKLPHDYPLKPPLVRFLTKIYHPNISRHGDIGIDCIQHNWTLALTIPQILLSVQSLLTDPCIEPCMESSIAQQYITNREGFDNTARIWTWKYAMLDILVH